MKMHALAIEYPGYGLYKTHKPSQKMMKEDAETVYDYLTQCIGIAEQDIILFGRSFGSGPALSLAATRNPHSILLMSAFTTLKSVARPMLGWASLLSITFDDSFDNMELIKRVQCPVMFIHGQNDRVVPPQHSQDLRAACPQDTWIHLPEKMDHISFHLDLDIVNPLKDFLL